MTLPAVFRNFSSHFNRPESVRNASDTAGPSRQVEREVHDQDREVVKRNKRYKKDKHRERQNRDHDREVAKVEKRDKKNKHREIDRPDAIHHTPNAINNAPTKSAAEVQAEKDVKDAKIKAILTTAVILAAGIAIAAGSHGLLAPVLGLVPVAWDKGLREIQATKDDLRMLKAEENLRMLKAKEADESDE